MSSTGGGRQVAAGPISATVLTSASGITMPRFARDEERDRHNLAIDPAGSLVVADSTALTVSGANGSSGGDVFMSAGANALTFDATELWPPRPAA